MKLPDANQLIPMVQNEILQLQDIKKHLEIKQKEIERDQFLMLKKLDNLKIKEELLSEKENKIEQEAEKNENTKVELLEKMDAINKIIFNLE